MAQIPLAQIPNAPDLSSMSAPQVNNVSLPKVDFGSERGAISRAYNEAEQNPNNAGFIGKAIAGVGGEVADVANDYIKKQQELNGIAGKSQFEALNSQVMEDVSSSLDPSQPHTWMGQFNQKWKQVTDWYQSQPQDVQRAVYPDLLKNQYGNMAKIGIDAHKTDIANKTATTISQVQQMAANGLYDDAKSLTDGLMHSGAISVDKKNEIDRAINSYKTDASATTLIAQDPVKAAEIFDRAAKAGDFSQAPDWMKGLQPKELENYAKKAHSVDYYRNTDKGMVAYDAIDQGKIKTVEQLEGSDVYKTLTPEWKASAKNKLLNEVVSGSPEGIKAVGDAYGSLNAFRTGKVDELAKDYHDMKLIGANLPPADAKNFLKEVDDIFQKRSEHGGSLPYDQQIRTSVSAELHKLYKDGGFGDPSSQEALAAYQQAENEWNKVSVENPHSYAEAESKYWQTQKNAAAAAALQKGPAPKQSGVWKSIMDWTTGSKPQASNDAVDTAGKITKYGYEKPGQADYDSNSARGIGAADNKLVAGESVALSPDLEKSTGAKIGDKVVVTLSNGEKMVKRFDDRTSKRLKGCVDIYSPDGNQPLDGVSVAKVERYTEDGQG